MQTITMQVQGMTCNGCVASVSRVLAATPGVTDAQVTLAPPQATVTYDPAKTTEALLRHAIEDAGYDVVA